MNSKARIPFSHLTVFALLCWLMSLPVHAATEAGRILFSRGTVSIVDDNDAARGAGTGSVFYEGDRVVTGNNSIVQLRLSDGALTALRSNSDYQVERQRFDEEEGVYEQAGKLLSGWMHSVTGTIGTRYPDKVSLGTSMATIGIRNTTYQIIHVPEEGLAEFPNLQAGSYVYLEEGQVEVSNAAGSRLISPGQVVRVSGPNNQIEVMPALVELFQSQSLLSFQSDRTEGFAVRELADEANQLIDRVIEGNEDTGSGVSDFSTKISALGLFGDSETGFDVPGTLVWAGTGENRYVQSMNISHVDDGYEEYQLTGNSDSAPSQLGYQQVLSESGQVVSQLHWGVWEEGTFTADDVVFDNEYYFFKKDWHFMLADNVLANSEAQGLTGRYRYSYVGGTDMSGYLDDAPDPSQMTLEEGTFVVNFD